MADEELLSTSKVAEKIGVSSGKVKKYIDEHEIHPDKTKGKCNYYGPSKVRTIEKGCGCKKC